MGEKHYISGLLKSFAVVKKIRKQSLVAGLAVVVVIIFFTSYGILNLMDRRAHFSAEQLVSEVVDHLNSKLSGIEDDTRMAALEAEDNLGDAEALERIICTLVTENQFVIGSAVAFEPFAYPSFGRCYAPFYWVTPDGAGHLRQLGTETDYYKEEWYSQTKQTGKEHWSSPYYDEGGAKVRMCTFSVPVKSTDGEFLAVITADIDLKKLESYIASITPNDKTYIILRSKDGSPFINGDSESYADDGNVVIKGEVECGWIVELVMPLSRLLSAKSGIMLIVLIIICFLLFVFLIYKIITRENERAAEEYQAKLEDALREATAANKSKTLFLNGMSHDIRTPMNAVLGYTSMALKNIDDKEKVLDYLSKVQQSGNLLLYLINSVLAVSRIESGKETLERQPADVFLSFANIKDTMLELAREKNIELTFEVDNITDRYIYCDYTRCMRIFINIITNSIKYTEYGGRIKVRCEQVGEAKDGKAFYRYTFEDNGIGMSDEFQPHIFEYFAREMTATVSGIQGTGLGMVVVKAFVDLMGGTISLWSKKGEGTVFTIILPFDLQDGEFYMDPVTGSFVSSEKKIEVSDADFRGKRALVVEDNEMNREITSMLLEEKGVVVDTATDGDEAISILKDVAAREDWFYYSFVLMDVQMPKMNGYEATAAVRAIPVPEGVHLPIIAMTANAFEEDRKLAIEAGMDDHIAKPVDVQTLWRTLSKYI